MDIFVVEGYEMTGKSTFIKKYLSDYAVYRPNYEGYDFDKYIPRNSRSLLGIELLNFIRNNPGVINKGVVLDRSLPSGIVYSKLYPFNGTPIDKKDIEKLVEIYKDVNAKIIYLYHPDSEYARKMYEASLKDSDHSDIYDKFESFGMYWGKYREAHCLFLAAFDEFFQPRGIDVILIPTSEALNEEFVRSKLCS